MASSIALKRASASGLVNKLFNPIRSVTVGPSVATRSFNAESQMQQRDERERSIDVDRRSDRRSLARRPGYSPGLFTDVFDPFLPPTSLSQILNMMDQMFENPLMAPARGMGGGKKRGWDAKEDENALYVRIDMPGLGKEDVKVWVEQNTLIITGEAKEGDEEGDGRKYSSRIDLPEKLYKLDEIKAEMKNGVLRLIIPKVKEEEGKDVHEVKIE
ncbi:hypothetical protein NE237_012148 [Protea cynaroides]|uniref:SHSP domain-containing protein n=1 Tax=Protea cynaroides TaxID=273540 RepID=A0A9Q0GXJ0_9MAGN|nr:hypothetical protein NE237_012148 [Protea cynaroides]